MRPQPPQALVNMNKMYVVLALLALAAFPTTNALSSLSLDERPLLALVTLESNPESPQLPPRATVSPGWDCRESLPWVWAPDFAEYELACTPTLPNPDPVASWSCRNPAVTVDATGEGSVTGTSYCQGVSATCTAQVHGTGNCHDVVIDDSGIPPLRCRVSISGLITSWNVHCYNDP